MADQRQRINNILIVNVHSYWNAGDAALTDVSLDLLAREFPNARFTLAMNDAASYHGEAGTVNSFASWCKDTDNHWIWSSPFLLFQAMLSVMLYRILNIRARFFLSDLQYDLLSTYYNADIVVSCAGNFLYTSGRVGLPFLLSILSMLFGVWANKPLYAMPQSVGPISRKWQQALVRRVLGKSRKFLIRDTISWAFLQEIRADTSPMILAPDVAFAMPEPDFNSGQTLLEGFGVKLDMMHPLLGVTVINWAGQQRAFDHQVRYETSLVEALTWFINERRGTVVFFPQVCGPTVVEDDRVTAQRIATQLPNLDAAIVIDRITDAETLMSAYGHLDAFLGTRLHSCIFALNQRIPVVPIAYQHKTVGIFEMLNLPFPVLPIEEVSGEKLTAGLSELLDKRDFLKHEISKAISEIRSQAEAAATYIGEDVCR